MLRQKQRCNLVVHLQTCNAIVLGMPLGPSFQGCGRYEGVNEQEEHTARLELVEAAVLRFV